MLEVQCFLRKHGLSINDVGKDSHVSEVLFNAGISNTFCFVTGRDEFGLPILKSPGGTDSKAQVPSANFNGSTGFAGEGVSGLKNSQGLDSGDINSSALKNLKHGVVDGVLSKPAAVVAPKPSSWSQVVKNPPVSPNSIKFDYIPLLDGVKVVSPPDDVLKKGNAKFKNCVVGSFSKSSCLLVGFRHLRIELGINVVSYLSRKKIIVLLFSNLTQNFL